MTPFTEQSNWNKDNLVRKVSYDQLRQEIAEYLLERAMQLRIPVTQAHQLFLGGVGFFLKETVVNDKPCTNLVFTAHPKDWNVNQIITELELKKYELYVKQGAI